MDQDLPRTDELTTVFARMSGLLLSRETVASGLRLVTSLATETIPGAIGAGVTLLDDRGRRTTSAASDPRVEHADRLQYELDEGPCLYAWAQRITVRMDEIATDPRWPRWSQAVGPLGLRAAVSTPLVSDDRALGALKVYADRPAAFGEWDERVLSLFAGQAAVLLANLQSYESAQQLTEGLREALRSRDVIGQAKGILMAREGVDEETAFAMLVRASQSAHRKLRDVAQQLVQSTSRRQQ